MTIIDVNINAVPPSAPTPPESETLEELALDSTQYGPKKVVTPEIEMEQFDPLTIQKAKERQAVKSLPRLSSLSWTKAVPKGSCDCD